MGCEMALKVKPADANLKAKREKRDVPTVGDKVAYRPDPVWLLSYGGLLYEAMQRSMAQAVLDNGINKVGTGRIAGLTRHEVRVLTDPGFRSHRKYGPDWTLDHMLRFCAACGLQPGPIIDRAFAELMDD